MGRIILKPGESRTPLKIEGLHYETGKPVSIFVIGGTIVEIKEIKALPKGDENVYVAPGFIDNQVNGYANVDFSGDDLTIQGIIDATNAIMKDGVTSFMPTLVTNSHEKLAGNFRILREACERDASVNAAIPGFHLEGPYISPEEGFRGCHQPEFIRKPLWEEFTIYQEAAGGRIIQVTVAPEIEGAQEFIRKCSSVGIVVAIGHSNANAEQVRIAVENGVKLSTHIGNGCANMIHRHNNPLWPQLANDNLTATIIADGNHLLPEEVKVFVKAKGIDRIILTSDVIYLAGMAPGNYRFAGMEVILKENGMLLNASQNCLAGASFPLKKGVENILEFAGVELYEAVKMASGNVARVYNLRDRGSLEAGKRADLVMIEKNGNKLNIRNTFKGGVPVA
jgi:N-acetylglucosamine-6-phosphate deacetylase